MQDENFQVYAQELEERLRFEANKRRFLYSDVEEIIDFGFLSQSVWVGDCQVVLRSTLPEDNHKINKISENRDGSDFIRWSIAYHVWMVNGFEVSSTGNHNAAYVIYDSWLKNTREEVLIGIYYTLVGLRNRVARAIRLVEAFCSERYSRSKWLMRGESSFDWRKSNIVCRIWRSHNIQEDIRKQEERDWEHTKVIAGSMSGKAFKQIEKFVKELDRKEQEYRQKIIEETVNWVIYGDEETREKEKVTVNYNGKEYEVPVSQGSTTVEEMLDEMRKVFAGEQDFHDLLVEEYYAKIKRKRKEDMEKRNEKLDQIRKNIEQGNFEPEPLRAYTLEELREKRSNSTTGKVHDGSKDYLYDRFVMPEIRPGVLGKEGPEEATSKNVGEVEEKKSLQERIANRNPQYRNN